MRLSIILFVSSISLSAIAQTDALEKLNELSKGSDLIKIDEQLAIVEKDPKNRSFAEYWVLKGSIQFTDIAMSLDSGFNKSKMLIVRDNFERAIDMDPTSKKLISERVELISPAMTVGAGKEFDKGDYKAAITVYKANIDIMTFCDLPDSIDHYNLAISYEKDGQIDKAKMQYQFCIDNNYYGGKSYIMLIGFLEKDGKQEEAKLLADKAFKAYPYQQELLIRMINRAIASEDYETCILLSKRAIQNDPDNDKLLYTLGTIYSDQGNFEQADKYLTMAQKINDYSFDASYQLAAIHMNRAIEIKQQADLLPIGDEKYDALKEEYMMHFRRALPPMERAHELNPNEEIVTKSLTRLRMIVKRDDISKIPAPPSKKEQKKIDKAKKKEEKSKKKKN